MNEEFRGSFDQNSDKSCRLRFQSDGDKLWIMAAPDKGEPDEAEAVRIIALIVEALTKAAIDHQVYSRKTADLCGRVPDCVSFSIVGKNLARACDVVPIIFPLEVTAFFVERTL